jgi:tripartite ATP-independent transporter DctM subunit
VPKLFAAALIPGMVLTMLYIIVAVLSSRTHTQYAPNVDQASFAKRLKALAGPWQFLTLFIATIGGIYAGIFSPTEAAAIGAFGVIVLGILGRRITIDRLWRSIEASVVMSCVLFVIIIGANLFSFFTVQTHLPILLADGARALHLPGPTVMVLIVIAYIVTGCFLEGIGMVLITVPVFLPLVTHFGYDPIWFSIIVVIVAELGLIHPPVGMNLFVIQAQAPDIPITKIYRGILPFLMAPLVLIILLFLFPQLALWLPKVLYG